MPNLEAQRTTLEEATTKQLERAARLFDVLRSFPNNDVWQYEAANMTGGGRKRLDCRCFISPFVVLPEQKAEGRLAGGSERRQVATTLGLRYDLAATPGLGHKLPAKAPPPMCVQFHHLPVARPDESKRPLWERHEHRAVGIGGQKLDLHNWSVLNLNHGFPHIGAANTRLIEQDWRMFLEAPATALTRDLVRFHAGNLAAGQGILDQIEGALKDHTLNPR